MKILFLAPSGVSGGPKVYRDKLIEQLSDLGVKASTEKISQATERYVWSKVKTYKKIGRKLASTCAGKIDLIHALGSAPFSAAGLEASRELGIPFIVSVHGLTSQEMLFRENVSLRHRLRAKFFEHSEKPIFNGADAIVTFSNLERRTIENKFGELPIHVIYHGSDHVPEIRLPTQTSRISYCKSTFRKGYDAFKEIAKRLPSLKFDVFLGTPHLPVTQKPTNVTYHPFYKDFKEYCTKIASTRILVHPSRHDSFCLVVLEAMRLGVIPIVSENTGVSELMDDVGEILPLEVDRWINTVPSLYASSNEKDRRRVIATAENCTWRKSAQEHLNVYTRV